MTVIIGVKLADRKALWGRGGASRGASVPTPLDYFQASSVAQQLRGPRGTMLHHMFWEPTHIVLHSTAATLDWCPWKKMDFFDGPSIQRMFDWMRGVRPGEPSNPGPAVHLLATNPTSLTDKTRHFADMEFPVAVLSEVATREPVQPEIHERFMKHGIKAFFGQAIPSSVRGTHGSTGFLFAHAPDGATHS